MDSNSDAPLSSLASMNYLRREIAKFERSIAEKTVRVLPSVTSPATVERRLLPRTPTAGIADSPVAVTPSSSPNEEGDSVAPRIDAPECSFGRSNATARVRKGRGSNRAGRATSRVEDGNDSDHRVTSTVEARSAGTERRAELLLPLREQLRRVGHLEKTH